MRIGIDFDRTIFDTDGFKQKLDHDFPQFSDTYREAQKNDIYRPGKHAGILGVELEELFDEFRKAKKFVYEDIGKLEKYATSDIKLFLVTRGDKEFQRIKIKSADISELFDEIAIIPKSIEELPKDRAVEMDLMIDDREDELRALNIPGIKVVPERKEAEKVIEAIEKGKELET